MKIFVSHKFRGVEFGELRENLEKILAALERQGYETFLYLRDCENWEPRDFPPGKVILDAFREIKNCDVLLVFLNHKTPSEGMLLEFGYAKAIGKKIVLLANEECCPTFLEAIADKAVKFRSIDQACANLEL